MCIKIKFARVGYATYTTYAVVTCDAVQAAPKTENGSVTSLLHCTCTFIRSCFDKEKQFIYKHIRRYCRICEFY